METQDFNKELLDYLYGEMNARERKEFEAKLSDDKELQKELEELSSVRNELEKLTDKEVMEPFSTWGKARSSNWFRLNQKRKVLIFRPVIAVAASLILLMLVGYLTNFSVSINEQGFSLSFANQNSLDQQEFVTAKDVKSIIANEVEKSNKLLLAKLTNSENSYNAKLAALEAGYENISKNAQVVGISQEDLQDIFINAENRNAETVREYLKLTSSQQQEYLKSLFTQFNNFYRKQRDDDLMFIQNSLLEIDQKQDQQQQETEKAIASLYTSVSQGINK